MSAQSIILQKNKESYEIKADAYNTFEDFYKLGMVLEQFDYTDEGFAGKQKFAPKYLNWAKVVRLMHFFDKDFTWESVKFKKTEDLNGTLIEVYKPFYQTDRKVSFVGIKFTFKGKEYYQEQPIMSKGNFTDVDIVEATRVDFSQRRALVKGVAEHLGLGLHLWSKVEVEELAAAATTPPTPTKKATVKQPTVKQPTPQVEIKVETPKNEIKTQTEAKAILPTVETRVEEGNILPTSTTKIEEVVKKETHLTEEEFNGIMAKVKPVLVGLSTSGHGQFVQELTTTLLAKHKVEKLSLLPRIKETLISDLVQPIKDYKVKAGLK